MSSKEGVNTTNCSAAKAVFSMRLASVVHHSFFFVLLAAFLLEANIPQAVDAGGIKGPVPERLSNAGANANSSMTLASITFSFFFS